jgi:hypothetical protein
VGSSPITSTLIAAGQRLHALPRRRCRFALHHICTTGVGEARLEGVRHSLVDRGEDGAVQTIGWIAYGLWTRDFSRGVTAFVVLFLPQEMYAISKENDAFPPLTHVVRNRFPGWFAFPLIFATVAAVSARWAALEWRAVGLTTLPVAALGWLIEHFLATYAGPDPRREGTAAGGERRAA